jgi:hypothetical protein
VRILVKDKRLFNHIVYDNEPDLQAVVINLMRSAFPSFFVIAADFLVEDYTGHRAKPDIVLIEREYRRWYVIEVERSAHSLDKHVLPQVETLANGAYNERHADWLLNKASDLDPIALKRMVSSVHPEVIVVADDNHIFSQGWKVLEERKLAHIALVEAFRADDTGEAISHWTGFEPGPPLVARSYASLAPLINGILVKDPGAVGITAPGTFTMRYRDKDYQFTAIPMCGTIGLQPMTRFDLRENKSYSITLSERNRLLLESN